MKGTPVLEGYVKELLLYNTKNLTVNHEVAVKSIWDIIRQDFGSFTVTVYYGGRKRGSFS